MTKFEKIKDYYEKRLWTKEQVHKSVGSWFTPDEADSILQEIEIVEL